MPLRVEGERLWPVPPLSLPAEVGPTDELTDSDAVRLFVERGRAVSPTFALDAGNAATVGEVCRRLDGLSLAIEMAAARLAILSPKEIARHLDDRFALLELSAAGRLTRHRTLEAAIDASHSLLSERNGTRSSASRCSSGRSTSRRPGPWAARRGVAGPDARPSSPPWSTPRC